MKSSVLSITCYFGLLWTLAYGATIPRFFEKHSNTHRGLSSTQIQQELGGQVSSNTLIFGPEDERFAEVTSRWTDFSKPRVEVVIEPGTEADVAAIVSSPAGLL